MGFDYSRLNIRRCDGVTLCPSCGFSDYFNGDSFDERGPLIGTGICPCCLYEPGFDDVAAASAVQFAEPVDALRAYSSAWWADDKEWRGKLSAKPLNWSIEKQFLDWTEFCEPVLKQDMPSSPTS